MSQISLGPSEILLRSVPRDPDARACPLLMGRFRVEAVGTSVAYHLAGLRHPDPLETILIASHRDAAKAEMAAAAAALGVARLLKP